ncbi:MAG: substrate-binding domain-containing protein, partial [Deinococcota bacterium]
LKLTTLVRPKLTTLHYPIDELGRLAAAHLLSQIKGETPAALDKLMPSLLVRDSSTLIQDTQKETPDET